jgi:glycosyltransferase involved in cell wall biosynthesis
MRIAIVAPPWLPIPPMGYGGTESIAHFLTEGLVKRGHDVTLFASGDSQTSARLISVFPQALGNSGEIKDDPLRPLLQYIECFERAEEFDIIHNHAQYAAMFLADLVKTPVVHTLHGSFAKEYTPEGKLSTLQKFRKSNFISISNAQRSDMPELNYVATVYNGINLGDFEFSDKKENYLFWIGRIAPKKGPVDAIQVAKKLNMRLKIAAVIDPIQQAYFASKVKPLIDGKLITFEGEVSYKEKSDLFKNALCTLYPVHWKEPFGLVMAESMACGTPVVALKRGSVEEIVEDGKTGYLSPDGVDNLTANVEKLLKLSEQEYAKMSKNARKSVEEKFTVDKMVEEYEKVYRLVIH